MIVVSCDSFVNQQRPGVIVCFLCSLKLINVFGFVLLEPQYYHWCGPNWNIYCVLKPNVFLCTNNTLSVNQDRCTLVDILSTNASCITIIPYTILTS